MKFFVNNRYITYKVNKSQKKSVTRSLIVLETLEELFCLSSGIIFIGRTESTDRAAPIGTKIQNTGVRTNIAGGIQV